jgi:tRNA G10  N-methylase Trm11
MDGLMRQFDAIVTDPPFGLRERFLSAYQSPSQTYQFAFNVTLEDENEPNEAFVKASNDTLQPISLLLEMAAKRLHAHGRLVFWLPTIEGVEQKEMEQAMQELKASVLGESLQDELAFVRCTPEFLQRGMWRWLCVFEKT